ncbi:DUF3618 domain-containing protein [Allosalinactinospora lopnorensis]|uniref:DUF3618 domain-containing protein n=1 Tax=Allosalinactinospora lopnorensis TaxID=1352348 RepID=UPI000696C838|nr:DUF3618 domain-containing protein [Allosalinactinospora lopnorensis]
MGTPPDEIRSDIDRTRAELSRDVDRLADRTSPQRTARRRAEQMWSSVRRLRERMMGGALEPAVPDQENTGETEDAAASGPEEAAHRTAGTPVTVGLAAFGAGALAAFVFRRTRRNRAHGGSMSRPVRRAARSGASRRRRTSRRNWLRDC